MKPVYKRTPQDCFTSCLESLVGHITGPVPLFVAGAKSNNYVLKRANKWLQKFKLNLISVPPPDLRNRDQLLSNRAYGILVLMNQKKGDPDYGNCHAVVGRANKGSYEILHDPDYFLEPRGAMVAGKTWGVICICYVVHDASFVSFPIPQPPLLRPEGALDKL